MPRLALQKKSGHLSDRINIEVYNFEIKVHCKMKLHSKN